MKVRPTSKGLASAFARRDKLAAQLARLDTAINEAGRTWSRDQGNIVPLRTEMLRRAVSLDLDEAAPARASR